MAAAAHFHQIGVGAQIARAHFRIGLKSAGAKYQRTGANFVFFVGIRHRDAFHAPVIANQLLNPRLITNLDVHPRRDLAPLHQLAQPAANTTDRMDHQARLKIVAAIDQNMAVDLPFDPELAHPMHCGVGLLHHHVSKLPIDSPAGYPL